MNDGTCDFGGVSWSDFPKETILSFDDAKDDWSCSNECYHRGENCSAFVVRPVQTIEYMIGVVPAVFKYQRKCWIFLNAEPIGTIVVPTGSLNGEYEEPALMDCDARDAPAGSKCPAPKVKCGAWDAGDVFDRVPQVSRWDRKFTGGCATDGSKSPKSLQSFFSATHLVCRGRCLKQPGCASFEFLTTPNKLGGTCKMFSNELTMTKSNGDTKAMCCQKNFARNVSGWWQFIGVGSGGTIDFSISEGVDVTKGATYTVELSAQISQTLELGLEFLGVGPKASVTGTIGGSIATSVQTSLTKSKLEQTTFHCDQGGGTQRTAATLWQWFQKVDDYTIQSSNYRCHYTDGERSPAPECPLTACGSLTDNPWCVSEKCTPWKPKPALNNANEFGIVEASPAVLV